MKNKSILLLRIITIYIIFCTAGIFIAIIAANFTTSLIEGKPFHTNKIFYWAVEKSLLAGPISAIWAIIYKYAHDFFIKNDS